MLRKTPRTGTPCIERPSTPITLLGQEPSFQTQVTGINNGGVTVGFNADSNGATVPNFFGFVDNGGTFTQVKIQIRRARGRLPISSSG